MVILSTTAGFVAVRWTPPSVSRTFSPVSWMWPATVRLPCCWCNHPINRSQNKTCIFFSTCNTPIPMAYIQFVTQYVSMIYFCDSAFYFCTWLFLWVFVCLFVHLGVFFPFCFIFFVNWNATAVSFPHGKPKKSAPAAVLGSCGHNLIQKVPLLRNTQEKTHS